MVNKLPRFRQGIDTSYDVEVPQSYIESPPTIIELPEIVDEMKQDAYIVKIKESEGTEDAHATFVAYDSARNALSFSPKEGNRG